MGQADGGELYWQRLARRGATFIPTNIQICPFEGLGFVLGIGVGSRQEPGFIFICDGDDLSLQKSFDNARDAAAWLAKSMPSIITWDWLTVNEFS